MTPPTGGGGRTLSALVVGVALLLLSAGPAQAADWDLNNLPVVDDQTLRSSIGSWSLDDQTLSSSIGSWSLDDDALSSSIGSWSLDYAVEDFATTTQASGETVVTFDADVLFEFAKSVLPSAASARITRAVAKAPKKGAVSIGGHTDNVGNPADNLKLSRARAQAVAAAVRSARPDLVLTVKGFGESKPVDSNAKPPGRSKNRRVELRFAG